MSTTLPPPSSDVPLEIDEVSAQPLAEPVNEETPLLPATPKSPTQQQPKAPAPVITEDDRSKSTKIPRPATYDNGTLSYLPFNFKPMETAFLGAGVALFFNSQTVMMLIFGILAVCCVRFTMCFI